MKIKERILNNGKGFTLLDDDGKVYAKIFITGKDKARVEKAYKMTYTFWASN
ncbi:MAG: hypothetical protein ACP5LI_07675 [Hydrogenobaculum sp.]